MWPGTTPEVSRGELVMEKHLGNLAEASGFKLCSGVSAEWLDQLAYQCASEK